jgi:hypothetical protein
MQLLYTSFLLTDFPSAVHNFGSCKNNIGANSFSLNTEGRNGRQINCLTHFVSEPAGNGDLI